MDLVENIGKSTIQHGKLNNRIYLMKYDVDDENIINILEEIQKKYSYSKIFVKIPERCFLQFKINGYELEGYVPGYYNLKEDALFLSKYFDDKRKLLNKNLLEKNRIIFNNIKNDSSNAVKEKFKIEILDENNINEITKIFKKVFESYPFPIFDNDYIKQTMFDNVIYFGVFENNELIAVSSSEIDYQYKNVEMTDFAVLPKYRGKKIAYFLLKEMEKTMKKKNILTLYTIARAESIGMNKTFLNSNYHYSGTLINNTNISGSLESMNIWYKLLI